MKLYTQDRERVIEMPREIWTTKHGDGCGICSTSYLKGMLAEYETEERAKEVLAEIFKYYRNGETSYILPSR